jgi:hypothetical protein
MENAAVHSLRYPKVAQIPTKIVANDTRMTDARLIFLQRNITLAHPSGDFFSRSL